MMYTLNHIDIAIMINVYIYKKIGSNVFFLCSM